MNPNVEPKFVIRAQDILAPEVVGAYVSACRNRGLYDQEAEARMALVEIEQWQDANPGRVKDPDHKHVPAQGQTYEITWMDRDGAYKVRSYEPEGVVIGTQDGVLMVATRAQNPTPLLVIPAQRLVSVELV